MIINLADIFSVRTKHPYLRNNSTCKYTKFKPMRKIEHLGIAVKSLKESKLLFSKLLGKESYKEESVEGEGVHTSFFMVGETKIELLEACRPDSPITRFLEKKSEGIHHIAFDVE